MLVLEGFPASLPRAVFARRFRHVRPVAAVIILSAGSPQACTDPGLAGLRLTPAPPASCSASNGGSLRNKMRDFTPGFWYINAHKRLYGAVISESQLLCKPFVSRALRLWGSGVPETAPVKMRQSGAARPCRCRSDRHGTQSSLSPTVLGCMRRMPAAAALLALPCTAVLCQQMAQGLSQWVLDSGSSLPLAAIARAAGRARSGGRAGLTRLHCLLAACFLLLVSLVPAVADGSMLSADGERPHATIGHACYLPRPDSSWSVRLAADQRSSVTCAPPPHLTP